ncbi:transglycosylase [Prevotella sp. BV3P1]|uniref:transglycosylase domain-containing protein n=1 Tax=Prevotellaceae TaxID=171552 RepID=UPI0003B80A6A|nr:MULTISPECIES: transglycosylase domain-containing protein [Prevotellaceae]ERT58040.1 transglycosylase [Prevotella sp. BV3P1]KGF40365.1 transglycosylase [Hoylesella buccalis DNF00985]
MLHKIKRFFSWLWIKLRGFWPWYKKLFQGKPWYAKTGIALLSGLIALIIYLGAVDLNFLWLFGKSPGFAQIKNPNTSSASEIYSADGKLIGKYFNENRTPVKYEEVNPQFWKALIDTEDERFYRHIGIDFQGLFGAAKDAIVGNEARGASTITQQLAKNMFRVRTQYSTGLLGKIPGIKILIMKSKEWIIALKLEMLYDKNEILTMYANTVDFGSNSYGVKTASKTYFNTSPANLTTEQGAVLVGMLKATTHYNPIANPKNSFRRRNVVLQNMVTKGDLSKKQYDSLSVIPIKLSYSVESNYDGQALYFREAVANYLKDWCEENGYDLYSSGLKIYTTIDTRMQKYAEEAARKQMKQIQRNFNNHWGKNDPWIDENGKVIPGFIEQIAQRQPVYKYLAAKYQNNPDSITYYLNKPHKVKLFDYDEGTIEKEMSTMDSIRYMVRFMHCSMVAMEPQTGAVKAWVGDINFNSWKYDKVTAMRQPGSTFKLFVYTEAMNQGLTPCDKRRDEYISMKVYDRKKKEEVLWTPGNANGRFSGDSIPLKSAFARSINSIAVRLGQEMGIKRIIDTAEKMGIKSPLQDEPSLALGSCDVNLLEMANAYCTVANDGKHHEPVLVTRIVDRDGRQVYIAPNKTEQVIPYKSAFLVQQLLLGGLKEPGGTSQSLWGYVGKHSDTEWGGKTGTSNNHSDAWFMCISPKLVVGAWVGGEYRSIHFRTGALGQGSRTALPICGYFLQAVLDDPNFKQYHGKFGKPKDKDITSDMYNCPSYYQQARVDTTATDSLNSISEEIILDEFGNPVSKPIKDEKEKQKDNSVKSHENHTPTEEVIHLDNL